MMECMKEQVSNIHKDIDGLQQEFKKKIQVQEDDLTKAIETINSSISETDNRLSKTINEIESKVVAEVVGMPKEITATAANTEVTSFATTHLKGYV